MMSTAGLPEGSRTVSGAGSQSSVHPFFLPDRKPGDSTAAAGSRRVLLACLSLLAVTVAVYAPVWRYAFVAYDDPHYVSENPYLKGGLTWHNLTWAFTTGYASNWHPLTWVSHMIDIQAYGLNGGAHHLTNLVLHIGSALLLFGFFYSATRLLGRSAFVAGVFALHPLHVESVAWVAERKDVLSTFFCMLALWAYLAYVRRPGLLRYLLLTLLFACGLMAKPMVVTFPFMLLLLDFWPLRRIRLAAALPGSSNPRVFRTYSMVLLEKVPLLALTVISSALTFIVQKRWGSVQASNVFPLSHRLENVLISYVSYAGKALWPAHLAAFYPYPQTFAKWAVIASLLLLITISAAVILAARRHPYLPVGWFWFLGTLVPAIGLVQVGEQSMADRYSYVPLIGLAIMMAWGVPDLFGRWPYRRMALGTAAALALLACGIGTHRQLRYWSSNVALWQHALDVTHENYVAHHNLGAALANQGKFTEAMSHYMEAMRIKPDYDDPYNSMGIALSALGRFNEAIPFYTRAVQLKPYYPAPHNNLGVALANLGRFRDAIGQYSETLRFKPDHVEARHNMAVALANLGSWDQAIGLYTEVIRLRPNYAEAHKNLGIALANEGRFGAAVAEYSTALRLKPAWPEARNDLGAALANVGKYDDAIAQYREALRLKPDYAEAHNNLGAVLANEGKSGAAMAEYAEALRLNPAYNDARRNLQATWASQNKSTQAIPPLQRVNASSGVTKAHKDMAAALANQGKVNEAIFEYLRALRADPNQSETLRALNELVERRNRSLAQRP